MSGKIIFSSILLLFFILPVPVIFAANLVLSNQSIDTLNEFDQDLEVDVNLNINSKDNTKYYLRGSFSKSGTDKYCGFTWNGDHWFNGPFTSDEGWKNLPDISVSSGSGNLRLRAKLDPSDKDCQDSGSYTFKVQRYTEGGSANYDDQNEIKLNVLVSLPTVTLKPEPTKLSSPVPSITKIKTAKLELVSTLETFLPTLTSIIIKSGSVSASVIKTDKFKNEDLLDFKNKNATVAGVMEKKSSRIPYLSLSVGISLIFLSSYLWYRKTISLKN